MPVTDSRPDSRAATQLRFRVALVVVAWAISEPLLLGGTVSRWAALAAGLVVATPLLCVRRAPIAVAATVIAAYLTQYALQLRMNDAMSGEMAVAFALFGVGAYAPESLRRTLFAVVLAVAVPGGLWVLSALDAGKLEVVYASQYIYLCGVAFAGVLPGFALSSRRREVEQLEGEVEELCARAAIEIGVAVDEERRALSRDLVRVVEGLVAEIQRLVAEARRGIGPSAAVPEQFGREMADAAGRAADELRALLQTLTTPGRDAAAGTARRRLPRPTTAQVRDAVGLALPVVLLAALSVVDRIELPDLPVSLATTSGTQLTIPASSVAPALGYLLAILTPVGLLWRRRAPLAAITAVAAMLALRVGLNELNSLLISHVFIIGALAYNAGAWCRTRRDALVGIGLTLAVTVLSWRLEEYRFETLVYVYMVGVLIATWTVGRGVHADLASAFALRDHAASLRGQRDRLRAIAVHGQRRDVAREMHDVVGHGLSLIVVQSGVVDVLAARDPARAAGALELVEGATRATRSELEALRTALGSPPDDGDADAFCRRTLERIVDDSRRAGQPVLAYVDPRVDELTADQRAALVRISQEALTNARKHAGGAAATLEVEVRADRVRLLVRNEPGKPMGAAPRGSGLGLRGMTERAQANGGTLTAGPEPGGGWAVRAEFPRDAQASLGPRPAAVA